MRYQPSLVACTAVMALLACRDGAVDPGNGGDGQEIATRFQRLADSVDGEGYSPTADALRHAAEIVRLTGRATPVRITIDGQVRSFLAVAEQLDSPASSAPGRATAASRRPGTAASSGPRLSRRPPKEGPVPTSAAPGSGLVFPMS